MVWIIVLLVALFIELATTALISIWFVIGAIPAYIVQKLGFPLPYQIGAFVIVSILAFILTKPFVKKFLSHDIQLTNVEALIGKQAVVVERITSISNGNVGAVKLEGKTWTARSSTGEEIEINEVVIVDRIEGVKVFVSKI